MKILIVSDTHGSAYYTEKILSAFEREGADWIGLLGDVLSSGSWAFPRGYDRKKTAEALNGYASKIIAVRGNCDSEADNGMLDFEIMSEYSTLLLGCRRFFLTHGHLYNGANLPKLNAGDALVSGHTHAAAAGEKNKIYMLNPGSAALPKENAPHTYGLLRERGFSILDLDGNTVSGIRFD